MGGSGPDRLEFEAAEDGGGCRVVDRVRPIPDLTLPAVPPAQTLAGRGYPAGRVAPHRGGDGGEGVVALHREGRQRGGADGEVGPELAVEVPAPAPGLTLERQPAGVGAAGGDHRPLESADDPLWMRRARGRAGPQLPVGVAAPAPRIVLCVDGAPMPVSRADRLHGVRLVEPLFDPELDRKRPSVEQGDVVARGDVLEFVPARHDLHVSVAENPRTDRNADPVALPRFLVDRSALEDLVGAPVHDVELVLEVDADRLGARTGYRREVVEARGALDPVPDADIDGGLLPAVEYPLRTGGGHHGREEEEVRIALVRPVADGGGDRRQLELGRGGGLPTGGECRDECQCGSGSFHSGTSSMSRTGGIRVGPLPPSEWPRCTGGDNRVERATAWSDRGRGPGWATIGRPGCRLRPDRSCSFPNTGPGLSWWPRRHPSDRRSRP